MQDRSYKICHFCEGHSLQKEKNLSRFQRGICHARYFLHHVQDFWNLGWQAKSHIPRLKKSLCKSSRMRANFWNDFIWSYMTATKCWKLYVLYSFNQYKVNLDGFKRSFERRMNYGGILSAFSFHLQGGQRINKKKLRKKSTKSHSMLTKYFPFQVTILQPPANTIETCTSITDPHYSSFEGFVKTKFLPILFSLIFFFSSCIFSFCLFVCSLLCFVLFLFGIHSIHAWFTDDS